MVMPVHAPGISCPMLLLSLYFAVRTTVVDGHSSFLVQNALLDLAEVKASFFQSAVESMMY